MPSSLLLALLWGCAEEPDPSVGMSCEPVLLDPDGVSFDPADMACVQVTMDPDDFQALATDYRFEGEEEDQWPELIAATALSCTEPYPNLYDTFEADIAVDGLEARQVGIHKKGFIGSSVGAEARPSLKVDTDTFVDGQELGSTERVVLNNNHQDASRIRTCLALSVFEDAGYPTPGCNLANVSVNGEGLGTYTHVEAVKKRFLRRAFGNDEGSLYEGSLADFTEAHLAGLPDNLGRFEAKTGDTDPTGAGLRRVADALQAPDEELERALEEVLDLDAFLLFWALETVVNHNDGYAANTNNFYLYFDPDQGQRATFVPWGPDQAFYEWPRSKATSELTRRMSRVPALRQQYLDELQWVLDEVWDEQRLDARIEAFAAQVATAEREVPYQEESTEGLRSWVAERRATVQAFIDQGGEEGAEQTGTCTGATAPEDFMLAAELATTAGAACSGLPGTRTSLLLAGLALLLGRRRGALA